MKLIFPEVNHEFMVKELDMTKKGFPRQTHGNVVSVLLNPNYARADGLYSGQIFYDEFSHEIKFRGTIRGEKISNGNQGLKIRSWDDSMTTYLGMEIERCYGINFSKHRINEAIEYIAHLYAISPPQQIIASLQWQGDKDAIRKLLPCYLGAEDSSLNAWIMEHVILGIIKRIFYPGTKFDEMMVLVGGQGIGKSTFSRMLALEEEWYGAIDCIQGKDPVINMMGKTVIEVEEFVALRNVKTANEAKAFVSRVKDTIRLPFKTYAKDIPRTCVLIGTLNENAFLNDHTGERRFLPVECRKENRIKSIYPVRENLETLSEKEYRQEIREDFLQAFAYGYYLFKENLHQWTLPKELEEALANEQERFKYLDPEVDIIRNFIEIVKPQSSHPSLTCYYELSFFNISIRPKAFNEIMHNYFPEWKKIQLPKTKRLVLNGKSMVVKTYYKK